MEEQSSEQSPFDPEAEYRRAWWLVGLVLVTLPVVRPLGGIAHVGPILLTGAAILQLYLPLSRMDHWRLDYEFIGLHFRKWRTDLRTIFILCAITFPPYIVGHHLYMEHGHEWLMSLGLADLARHVPQVQFDPKLPQDWQAWGSSTWWFLTMTATHVLGVALPEETFYRGYLQPRLEHRWPPVRRFFGVALGRAAVISAALFALGHFLGEWNPLRLGPFFPALIFAWQRNASGTVMGAIGYHAACNILGELLFAMYR